MDYKNTYKVLVSFLVDGISKELLTECLKNTSIGLESFENENIKISNVRRITPFKVAVSPIQTLTALVPTLKLTLMLMAEIHIDLGFKPRKWDKYIAPSVTTIGLQNLFSPHTYHIEKCTKILY